MFQLLWESQIKSKTPMSWNLWKKKEGIFGIAYFVRRKFLKEGIFGIAYFLRKKFFNICLLSECIVFE